MVVVFGSASTVVGGRLVAVGSCLATGAGISLPCSSTVMSLSITTGAAVLDDSSPIGDVLTLLLVVELEARAATPTNIAEVDSPAASIRLAPAACMRRRLAEVARGLRASTWARRRSPRGSALPMARERSTGPDGSGAPNVDQPDGTDASAMQGKGDTAGSGAVDQPS